MPSQVLEAAPGASAVTQSDKVFAVLRAEILGCDALPGSRLRINDIAARLEVSLGAVREALSRLGAEGLVVAESQKGYRVAPLSIPALQDLTEARVEIERVALRRALERGDLEWESALVAAWHRLARLSAGGTADGHALCETWAQAHAAFHAALVAACGSARLLQIREQLYEQSERYRRYSGVVGVSRDVLAEHRQLFDLAIARDPEAVAAIERHLRRTTDIIVSEGQLDRR